MRRIASLIVLAGALGLLLPAEGHAWQAVLGGDRAASVKIDAVGDVVAAGDGAPTLRGELRVAKFAGATGLKQCDAQDSRSFRRTGRRRGPISGRFNANATVASMNPTFSPAS